MKRLSCVLVAVLLVMCMSATVFAQSYGNTFTGTNFQESYSGTYYNGAVYVQYTVGNLLTNVTGSTRVSVSNDAYGNAYVYISGLNGQVGYSRGYTVSNNWISSGVAGVAGTDYAKKMIHTGERTVSGVTDTWSITFT